MAQIPYAGTLSGSSPISVDHTGETVSTLPSAGYPQCYWMRIANRPESSNNVDVSFDGGTTFTAHLLPGESRIWGGVVAPIAISSVFLKCPDSGGTATCDVECLPLDQVRL